MLPSSRTESRQQHVQSVGPWSWWDIRNVVGKVWNSLFLKKLMRDGTNRHTCDLGMQVGLLAVWLVLKHNKGCLCTPILTNDLAMDGTRQFEFRFPTLCDKSQGCLTSPFFVSLSDQKS